jgi:hypothetical protein
VVTDSTQWLIPLVDSMRICMLLMKHVRTMILMVILIEWWKVIDLNLVEQEAR